MRPCADDCARRTRGRRRTAVGGCSLTTSSGIAGRPPRAGPRSPGVRRGSRPERVRLGGSRRRGAPRGRRRARPLGARRAPGRSPPRRSAESCASSGQRSCGDPLHAHGRARTGRPMRAPAPAPAAPVRSERVEHVVLVHVRNLVGGLDHRLPVRVDAHDADAAVLHVEAAEARGRQACARARARGRGRQRPQPGGFVGTDRTGGGGAPRLVDRSALIIDLWLMMRMSAYLSSVMMRSHACLAFT